MKYYRIEFIYDFYEIIKTTNKIQKVQILTQFFSLFFLLSTCFVGKNFIATPH